MRKDLVRLLGLTVVLLAPVGLQGHGGGLDSLGCHHNRKTGGYHCHRGPLAGSSFSSKGEAQKALSALQSERVETPQPSSSEEGRPRGKQAAETITAAEAKDHTGETATVCGKVVSARYAASSRGRPTFLNLDKPYPNHVFTAVIWGDNRAKFGKPEEEVKDKEICVSGMIESYRGKPQIEVSNPKQIRVPDQE